MAENWEKVRNQAGWLWLSTAVPLILLLILTGVTNTEQTWLTVCLLAADTVISIIAYENFFGRVRGNAQNIAYRIARAWAVCSAAGFLILIIAIGFGRAQIFTFLVQIVARNTTTNIALFTGLLVALLFTYLGLMLLGYGLLVQRIYIWMSAEETPRWFRWVNLTSYFFIGIFLTGLFLTGYGVSYLNTYSGSTSDTILNIHTGMQALWYPSDPHLVTVSQINVNIYPSFNGSQDILNVGILPYGKPQAFYFFMTFPFKIEGTEGKTAAGVWNYSYMMNVGSIVSLTYLQNASQELPTFLQGFEFTDLPTGFDHGTYSLYFPFSEGASSELKAIIPAAAQSASNPGNSILDFTLSLGLSEEVLQSFPAFSSSQPFQDLITNASVQQLNYRMNESTSLSSIAITFQDPKMVDTYSLDETLGVICLGAGIPLMTTVGFELYRYLRERQRRSAVVTPPSTAPPPAVDAAQPTVTPPSSPLLIIERRIERHPDGYPMYGHY